MKIAFRIAVAIGLLIAALAGYAGWLGYFGGDLYVPVKATAKAPPGLNRVAVVIISGDMGFKTGMGPQVAARFAARGVPVLGVNSLVYFRDRRSPAEVQGLIADSVRRGLAFGHADRLVLIGQSYGADIVHVGLTGVPPALRAKLAMVALVVPTDSVIYRASPFELLDLVKPDAPAIDTGRQLTWVPTLCVQGREETDSLCPMLTSPNVRTVALPGGHPLRRDADALFDQLFKAATAS